MNKKIWLALLLTTIFLQTAEGAHRRGYKYIDRWRYPNYNFNHYNNLHYDNLYYDDWFQPWVSRYARDVVALTNVERRKAWLRALQIDNELMAAAAQRAREIERHLAHTRPDGRPFNTIFREFQVKSYNRSGENLILYYMSDSPAEAVRVWMNSPKHQANILRKEFTHTGVGVHRSGNRTYAVQFFAAR